MARWQPGARERLRTATLDLFTEQGFERTTVAEIAARAGLTERTFFRHFADKREVLFTDQAGFESGFTDRIAAAGPDVEPLDAVMAALAGVAEDFFTPDHRPFSRRRQAVIDANPGLQEREQFKLAGLAGAMASALRERGTPPVVATLTAELGVTVVRVAFARWVSDDEARELGDLQEEVLDEVRGLLAGGSAADGSGMLAT